MDTHPALLLLNIIVIKATRYCTIMKTIKIFIIRGVILYGIASLFSLSLSVYDWNTFSKYFFIILLGMTATDTLFNRNKK